MIYPAALLLVCACLGLAVVGRIGVLAAGGILIPMEMAAAVSLGGASVNVADLYYLIVAAYVTISFFASGNLQVSRSVRLPLAICVYAIFATLILPQVFAGKVLVFSVSGESGVRVSSRYLASLVPLHFSMSNISQLFYTLAVMVYVILFAHEARRRGAAVLERILVLATLSHAAMSLAEAVGLDLSFLRTADYRDLGQASVLGSRRIVGMFAEASTAGVFSSASLAYFAFRFLASSRPLHFVLASIMAALTLATLSSTAFAGLAAFAAFLVVRSVFAQKTKSRGKRLLLLAVFLVLVLLGFLLFSGDGSRATDFLTRLVLDKGASRSGLERAAWTVHGWQLFKATYGLGVGAGSTIANSLLIVWLANFGLIGTVLYLLLVARALPGRGRVETAAEPSIYPAALAGFCTLLGAMMASHTLPNLQISFALFLTLCISTRPIRLSRRMESRRQGGAGCDPAMLV